MSLNLAKVVFFSRTLEEYERFWMLPIEALPSGPVLDCPSGPTDFVARARQQGLDVVGVDPAYTLPPTELAVLGRQDIALTVQAIRAQGDVLAGPEPDAWGRAKQSALESFLDDFRRHHPHHPQADGRYVAAALPDLPFPDRHFALVLSGHLLLCYAAVGQGGLASEEAGFDLEWHLAALDELARVTRCELRLYPVTRVDRPAGGASGEDPSEHQHPYLGALCDRLRCHGFEIALRTPNFDQGFERTGSLLIARRTD